MRRKRWRWIESNSCASDQNRQLSEILGMRQSCTGGKVKNRVKQQFEPA